jgi:hypothetical protein
MWCMVACERLAAATSMRLRISFGPSWPTFTLGPTDILHRGYDAERVSYRDQV